VSLSEQQTEVGNQVTHHVTVPRVDTVDEPVALLCVRFAYLTTVRLPTHCTVNGREQPLKHICVIVGPLVLQDGCEPLEAHTSVNVLVR
jgi:hypothetical protein